MVFPTDPLYRVCPHLHDCYKRSVFAAFYYCRSRRPVCPYKASNFREHTHTRLNLLPHATSSIEYGSRHKHIFAWCCDVLQIFDMELYQVLRPNRILSLHMLASVESSAAEARFCRDVGPRQRKITYNTFALAHNPRKTDLPSPLFSTLENAR